MAPMTISTLAEVDATDFFIDEGVDWRYCLERATFAHTAPDVCEFIVHAGERDEACRVEQSPSYADARVKEMRAYGCTEGFIAAYLEAIEDGATRVLFFA